jgi:hypothetical protein
MGARVGLGTLAGAGIIIEANGLKTVIDNSSNNAWSLQGSNSLAGNWPHIVKDIVIPGAAGALDAGGGVARDGQHIKRISEAWF